MKFLLGTKQNMVQYFAEDGKVFPATLITAGPVVVTQVKNKENDGYEAVQVGFGEQKEKRLSKAVRGHLKDLGFFRHIKEFRPDAKETINAKKGDKIDVSVFNKGDMITASSVSKGKGFQGVVKRHGFHGGPRTHGQKHSEREPGSIGGGLRTRVPKGMRMAGRMGSDLITIKGLEVLEIDKDNNTLLIAGAVPGRRGSLIELRA
jgi:large subunit ribosomal protein L3